jgi:alpha-beta hydrolase superfamily lysophospholipase
VMPTLMQVSESDPVISTPEVLKFFASLPYGKKTLKTYKDRKHEIYNDLGREEVFEDIREFLSEVEAHV